MCTCGGVSNLLVRQRGAAQRSNTKTAGVDPAQTAVPLACACAGVGKAISGTLLWWLRLCQHFNVCASGVVAVAVAFTNSAHTKKCAAGPLVGQQHTSDTINCAAGPPVAQQHKMTAFTNSAHTINCVAGPPVTQQHKMTAAALAAVAVASPAVASLIVAVPSQAQEQAQAQGADY